jgi:oligopeptidase A
LQLPVAFLTCNFSAPTADTPSLLTHNEVTTLFHEFGHGLHHMLTKINCAAVSGINGVPWDAVELPSQFLENWCWEKESIGLICGHYQTGEQLPDSLLEKMLKAKNFQAGMQMLRQLEFALFDLSIHSEKDCDIKQVLETIRQRLSVYPVPAFNSFQHSFSHIFAGGYAAGYYSYKWAEVLSADAFSRFEEEGIFCQQTAQSFLQQILEKGGSETPMQLFSNFRGREPNGDALLRHCGIN